MSFSTKIKNEQYKGRLEDIQKEIEKEMKGDLLDFQEIATRYCSDIKTVDVEPVFGTSAKDLRHGLRTFLTIS